MNNTTSLFCIPINKEKDNEQNKSNNQDNNNNQKEIKENNQFQENFFSIFETR